MVMTESLSDSSMSEMNAPASPGGPPRGPILIRSEEHMMGGGNGGLPPHSSLFCSRKQREFTPDSKKDDTYWDRRRRNNAAAKRSREKRRLNDMLLEKRVVQLSRENHILRAQVTAVFKSYGIRTETLIDMDQVMATLPTEDQLLNMCSTPSRSLASPPPPEALRSPPSMMALSSPASPPEPASPRLEDIYRHHFPTPQRARSPTSMAALAAAAAAAASTVQISPRSPPPGARQIESPIDHYKTNTDLDLSPPAPKRAYMAWEQVHERRAASSSSNVSSPCESNSGSDDPLNLTTCKSRSRSSSENEDDLHHMPHKLRYKYHHGGSQDNAGDKHEHEY